MYIYKIINLINNKIYIGKSKRGIEESKNYYGSGILLNKAIEKYGIENFKKEILQECNNLEQLNKKEKFWIKKLDSFNKNIGYNLTYGGEGGDTHTLNPNKNIIQQKRTNTLRKKCYNNPEWRKNCSNGMIGIKKSNTENMKKPHTIDHNKKVSMAIKKKFDDPAYRKKFEDGQKKRWENYYKQKNRR